MLQQVEGTCGVASARSRGKDGPVRLGSVPRPLGQGFLGTEISGMNKRSQKRHSPIIKEGEQDSSVLRYFPSGRL